MQRVAIFRNDLLTGEMPVFFFNPNNKRYEHFYGTGKHSLIYDEQDVEDNEKWIVFEVDRENQQYFKIKGDF